MQTPVAQIARSLLTAGPGGFHELLVFRLGDDESTHDDAVQEQAHRNVVAVYERALAELTGEFGGPVQSGTDGGPDLIPLCGVFRYAVWSAGGLDLYLAAAHEDRECPYLLVVGTAST